MRRITISLPLPHPVAFGAGLLLLGIGIGHATLPADADALVYAGVLEENGALVDDPARPINVVVKSAGGATLCATGNADREVVRGRFRVPLPAECAADLRANAGAVVVVEVEGAAIGAPAPVTAVPYALEAGAATTALAATSGAPQPDGDPFTIASNGASAFQVMSGQANWILREVVGDGTNRSCTDLCDDLPSSFCFAAASNSNGLNTCDDTTQTFARCLCVQVQ